MDYSLRPYSGVIRGLVLSLSLRLCSSVRPPLSLSLSLSLSFPPPSLDRILRRRRRDGGNDDEWLREDRTISANSRHSYPRRIRDQREYRKWLIRIFCTCVRRVIETHAASYIRRDVRHRCPALFFDTELLEYCITPAMAVTSRPRVLTLSGMRRKFNSDK